MPMFSNRTVAAMLQDLSPEVQTTCAADLVGRIQRQGHAAIAAEWELLVLRQLHFGGNLALAPHGAGVPDAIFEAPNGERIVVEVTALSDDDLLDRYPLDLLGMLFYRGLRRLRKETLGAFDVHASWPISESGLPVAALPTRGGLFAFMQSKEVRDFLRAIADEPTKGRRFQHEANGATTTVVFRPGARFSSGSGAVSMARSFNPHNKSRLLRKLSKKVKQFSNSKLGLPAVLVLCDADCRMLRERPQRGMGRDSAVDSIGEYIMGRPELRYGNEGPWVQRGAPQRTTSINAVIVLTVGEMRKTLAAQSSLRLELLTIRNNGTCKYPLSDATFDDLLKCFESTPRFQRTPMNAKEPPKWPDNTGAWQVSGERIVLPLLVFQDLLAGKVSHKEFSEMHSFAVQHIQRLIARGRCISSTRIIPSEDGSDDDWIELEFAGNDPRNLSALYPGEAQS